MLGKSKRDSRDIPVPAGMALAMRDKNVPPITLRGLFDSLGIMALALGVLVLLLFPPKGARAAGTPELSIKDGVSETTQRVPTQGGGIKGELVVHVLKADPSPNAPVIVLCPGSWEYSKAWEVYFPPFTPEFLAKRGFVVVTWDPRGAFMFGAGAATPQEFLEPNRYGLGASSPFPPAVLMLSRTFVEDYERILSFTESLEGINKLSSAKNDTINVSFDLTNSGEVDGNEVVQLYVGFESSKIDRSVKELKGFEKVAVAPGETKRITIPIKVEDLAYYNVDKKDWEVENITYSVYIGASSKDIRLKGEFTVN